MHMCMELEEKESERRRKKDVSRGRCCGGGREASVTITARLRPAIPHADTHVRNLRIHECTLAFVLAGGRVGSQGPGCVTQLARLWVLRSHGGESATRSPPSIRTSVTVPPCKPAAYLYQEVRLTSLVWS
ncbi:hypothetical protein E2C01_053313 [Portunus trituberculatus]|uniref:Uncharacterized protein n=1 Tax=Portunus trituberculatus TaxID=210409 RepID=A0A5B7GPZ8_PORTR|nr:hypothetical protein [Portunus trituberculatus]